MPYPFYKDAMHFVDGADAEIEYEYNKNGCMTKDLNKNISKIEYNLLNLPTKLSFEDGSVISYSYDADGNKLSANYNLSLMNVVKGTSSNNAQSENSVTSHRDYCGNFIYEDGALKMMLFDGGYVTFDSNNINTPQYHFYIKDHLGNNRVVADANGNIEQVNHYYPFGGLMAESTGDVQPYKYNGKELDRMHGLDSYDYGARMYYCNGIRWGLMDPLAEVTPNVSPYGYCGNNPVRRIDYKGMLYGDYYDSKGNLLGNDGVDDKKIYVMRTTKTSFESYGEAPVNNIPKKQAKTAANEIREFSGNASHDFSEAQKSFVELDGSSDIRKEVLSCIKDDGTGGTSDNNNREYGMNFEKADPVKVYSTSGDIAKPGGHMVSVEVPFHHDLVTIHSHPSGNIIPNLQPAPSAQDITNGFGNCNSYVIDMSNKIVYIYNKTGILSSFPLNIYTK